MRISHFDLLESIETFKKLFKFDFPFEEAIYFAKVIEEFERSLGVWNKLVEKKKIIFDKKISDEEKTKKMSEHRENLMSFSKKEYVDINFPAELGWNEIKKFKDRLILNAYDIKNLSLFLGKYN